MKNNIQDKELTRFREWFWKELAMGGVTSSTPDSPPEGYADWQCDPATAEKELWNYITTNYIKLDEVKEFMRELFVVRDGDGVEVPEWENDSIDTDLESLLDDWRKFLQNRKETTNEQQ